MKILPAAALLAWNLGAALPGLSQTTPSSPPTKEIDGKVYTYVEKMPELPGGGGTKAIVDAIQSKVVYPELAVRNRVEGRLFVAFTVSESGAVTDVKTVKGLGSGCDEAAVAAVQQLPRFVPGIQGGRPAAVSYTVPITFRLLVPPPSAPPSTAVPDSVLAKRVYTYVEQMPELPGGGGVPAIVNAIQSKLRYPPMALREGVEGKVYVAFSVTPTGTVEDIKIVKGLGRGCDEAVLTAIKRLPQFRPGTQNGRPVTDSFTVPVTFKIDHLAPAVKQNEFPGANY